MDPPTKAGRPDDRFVERAAGREEIGRRDGRVAQDLFRRHVTRSPDEDARAGQLVDRLDLLREFPRERPGETEVEQLDAVLRQEHVGGFQVAVQRARVVERLERREDPPARLPVSATERGPRFKRSASDSPSSSSIAMNIWPASSPIS